MKKLLALIISGTVLTGFGLKNHISQKPDTQVIEVSASDYTDQVSYESEPTDININSIDANNIDDLAQTGISYIKANDYDDLSQEEKSYMYDACLQAMDELGFDSSEFTYEDMNGLYDKCRNYMLENNIDPDSFGMMDKAKVLNMCRNYLKDRGKRVGCMNR